MTAVQMIDLSELKPILEKHAPGGRAQLLPTIWDAQKAYGHISEPVAAAISKSLKVPLADIYGVIEFYTMLYHEPVGETFVRICTSPMCDQAGGEDISDAVCEHFGVQPGETTPDGKYTIEAVECLGLCDHAPAALVRDVPVSRVTVEDIDTWVSDPVPAPASHVEGNPGWLVGRIGKNNPTDLDAFTADQGYAGLHKALKEMTREQVIDEIIASGLSGRGGAAFPTGMKWKLTAGAQGGTHYLVCNADESEPGTFKDRVLMEGDPFSVLEGMAIAGYVIGAMKGYIYIRGEYPRVQKVMQTAIDKAVEGGYLGENILGSDFTFDVEIRSGAGAYICGEETSLFESIEGKRGFPRLKPPYPTTNGLFDQPTTINNVETLCTAAWIIANSAAKYRSVGTEKSPGTKLFCLSGDVAKPGVYEAPFGTTMRDLIEMAGGVAGDLQAVLVGGAAGEFASPDQVDLPMSFEGLQADGLSLGSGVINVINQECDLKLILYSLAHFFRHESCGKCFPCQLGTMRQLEIMDHVLGGSSSEDNLAALDDVIFTMTNASLCGLGMTAGTAIESAMQKFPEVFHNGRG